MVRSRAIPGMLSPQPGCPKRKVRASPEANLLRITLWGSQSLILYCNAIFGRCDADATRMSGPQTAPRAVCQRAAGSFIYSAQPRGREPFCYKPLPEENRRCTIRVNGFLRDSAGFGYCLKIRQRVYINQV